MPKAKSKRGGGRSNSLESKASGGKKAKKTTKGKRSQEDELNESTEMILDLDEKNKRFIDMEDSSQEDDDDGDEDDFDVLNSSGGRRPEFSSFEAPIPRRMENSDGEAQGYSSNEDVSMSSMASAEASAKKQKRRKPGIIYLSSIPKGFNVARTTVYFSQYGQVGRVFLQPDAEEKARSKDNLALRFVEGWIEFQSKRVARDVAENLNAAPVGGKKKSQTSDILWNIKYLPRFKWAHLTERLNYERASHQQKMRTEISRAKKEADFFSRGVKKSTAEKRKKAKNERNLSGDEEADNLSGNEDQMEDGETEEPKKKKAKKSKASGGSKVKEYEFRQKLPEAEFVEKKKTEQGSSRKRKSSAKSSSSPSKNKKSNKNSPKKSQKPPEENSSSEDESRMKRNNKKAVTGGGGGQQSSSRDNLLNQVFGN